MCDNRFSVNDITDVKEICRLNVSISRVQYHLKDKCDKSFIRVINKTKIGINTWMDDLYKPGRPMEVYPVVPYNNNCNTGQLAQTSDNSYSLKEHLVFHDRRTDDTIDDSRTKIETKKIIKLDSNIEKNLNSANFNSFVPDEKNILKNSFVDTSELSNLNSANYNIFVPEEKNDKYSETNNQTNDARTVLNEEKIVDISETINQNFANYPKEKNYLKANFLISKKKGNNNNK